MNILLIDDDKDYRETVSAVLEDAGIEVISASCPDDAFPLLFDGQYSLIICDLHMPFTEGHAQEEFIRSYEVGIKTIRELAEALPHQSIIALSAAAPSDLSRIQSQLDPVAAFSKPVNPDELLKIVRHSVHSSSFDA